MGDGAIKCDGSPRAMGGGRQAAGYGPHAADGG